MHSVADIRRSNEQRALSTLFRDGPDSRAGLARRLSLTRSTAGILVDTLLEAGLAREARTPTRTPTPPTPPATRPLSPAALTSEKQTGWISDSTQDQAAPTRIGRPGKVVGLRPEGAYFLGATVAVDQLVVVTLDLAGKTWQRKHLPHDGRSTSPETTIGILAGLVDAAAGAVSDPGLLQGVSVTVPGFIDESSACHAANLGWSDVPAGALLEKSLRVQLPCLLENDANANAVAELYACVADGSPNTRDLVVVLIEDGVGAGILEGGRLLRGRRHGAGEIGHMPLGPSTGPAAGRQKPHVERFETQVGRIAVLEHWHARGGYGDIDTLIEACAAGDAVAIEVAQQWAVKLARGLASVACTLEPQAFIIGGSVGRLARYTLETLHVEMNAYLPPGYPSPGIEPSRLDSDGCAMGAASLLHAQFLDDLSVLDESPSGSLGVG